MIMTTMSVQIAVKKYHWTQKMETHVKIADTFFGKRQLTRRVKETRMRRRIRCITKGCDARHCDDCGRHIDDENPEKHCYKCLVKREEQIAEKLYGGNKTDEEKHKARQMWDI